MVIFELYENGKTYLFSKRNEGFNKFPRIILEAFYIELYYTVSVVANVWMCDL